MNEGKGKILPVDRFYNGRKKFSIIGLTGMAGSGCSTLAKEMSSREFLMSVREPKKIRVEELPQGFEDNEFAYQNDKLGLSNKAISSLVFKQKYTICYEFAQQYYQEFKVLKYTHVLWLYTLLSTKKILENCNEQMIKKTLCDVIADKYRPRRQDNHDLDYKKLIGFSEESRKSFIYQMLNSYQRWEELCNNLNQLQRCYVDDLDNSKEGISELNAFTKENGVFEDFVAYLLKELAEEDYYSLCLLHHRLAVQIRMCGNPFDGYKNTINEKEKETQYLYNVVKLIYILIKGYKKQDVNRECRIVIDSLRNSLEARFFKERYTAFYLVCVNDSEKRESRLLNILTEKMPKTKSNDKLLSEVFLKIKSLTETELSNEQFSNGVFASPDVENVIADAEIHINNSIDKGKAAANIYEFCTMEEQWMKYSSLILHPGLITPSAEERCMVVAYTAKFNSSCLSRQVGAVITNQYHSIRTIGWNDVPYGQMPCGLRELHMMHDVCTDCRHMYSEFELGPHGFYSNRSFTEKIYDDYSELKPKEGVNEDKSREELKPNLIKGLPYAYCFKTLHNKFEGEKNQVYSRSLHAEENAILQMAKYGGEPLINGIIYVTASPCELCAKKLYQIGVRKIVYIDPYPGISMNHIIQAGFKRPHLKLFQGAYGASYFKLYQPFMSYKDELGIRLEHKGDVYPHKKLLSKILEKLGEEMKPSYTKEEIEEILKKI